MTVNTSSGLLNGPYLWFILQSLNLIVLSLGRREPEIDVTGVNPGRVLTVSPGTNVPVIMLISKSLGIINLFTSCLSKNAYTRVYGFNLFAVNEIFRDLIYFTRSYDNVFSPTLVFSNDSISLFLDPDFSWTPVFIIWPNSCS